MMSKYIDADRLWAEIESYRKECEDSYGNPGDNDFPFGKVMACQEIIGIINSLQQEEEQEVDLEKEFNSFLDNVEGVPRMWHPDEQIEEEEMPDKTLDEAANKFGFKETHERLMEGEITRKNERMFRWQIEKAFKAGAKWQEEKDQEIIKLAEDHAFLAVADWQKEQMMKGAVEGVVISTSDNNWECIRIYEKVHSVGDKVTVQIRKANENTFQH